MTVGKKIMLLRSLRDERQQNIEEAIGITRVTLSNIERDLVTPSENVLHALADYFGITYEELIDPDNDPVELVGLENIYPEITPLVTKKTPTSIEREKEIATLPSIGEQLEQLQDLYGITTTELANAPSMTNYVITAALKTDKVQYRNAIKLAKLFDLYPTYFIDSIPDNNTRSMPKKPEEITVIVDQSNEYEVAEIEEIIQRPTLRGRLIALRSLLRLSPKEISRLTGISLKSYMNAEQGTKALNQNERIALGALYNVDPDVFVEPAPIETEAPKPEPEPVVVKEIINETVIQNIPTFDKIKNPASKMLAIAQFLEQAKLMFEQNNITDETLANLTILADTLHSLTKGAKG